MAGTMVEFGSAAQGYLATPREGVGAGVLVLHAWWGLNDFFRSLCDRLAGEGFVAFAPDLYGGKIASTIDEASQLMESSDYAAMRDTVLDAVRYLVRRPDVRAIGIGVVGFSMGAAWAAELSRARPQTIRAVVLFYGTETGDFTQAQAAFLGHYCEEDEWEPSEGVEALEKALSAAGRNVTFYRYPDTGHWFMEQDRPETYAPEAARLAWERTVAFLKEQLAEEFEPMPQSTDELLGLVNDRWAKLQALLSGRSPEQLMRPGPDGWSIKEHVAHISFWEDLLLRSYIGGEPGETVTGMDAATLASVDAINAIVAQRAREKSLDQVLAESQATHDAVLTELASRPIEGWMQPRFQDDPDERPLMLWIGGNTWGHYEEHIDWIGNLL